MEAIADRKYQERSWLGNFSGSAPYNHQEMSSPDEDINRLYSDLDFEEVLHSNSLELNARQQRAGTILRNALNEYTDQTPEVLDPVAVIDDPRWERIRILAKEFADALRT